MLALEEPLRVITAVHGAFLRREASELGIEDRTLRRAIRHRYLVKVRHGSYAFSDEWSALDDVGRFCVLTRGALRTLGDRVAASHHSAAALIGLDVWDVPLDTVHVTRLDDGAGRRERDIRHHAGLVLPEDVYLDHGYQVMRPVRAALESAMLSGVERGLITVSSGLHRGFFDREALLAQHQLMQTWPNSQHLHVVTRLADERLESVAEARSMHLFWRHGLPKPELQYEIWDGGRLVGAVDFAWPEHRLIVEFDGRVKYEKYLREGEEPGDAVFREKRREDDIRRVTGWRVIRLTWADLAQPARTAAMIRAVLTAAA
jgi:hypothetical protein